MRQTPKFTVEFIAEPSRPNVWPARWSANHDGPLEDVKRSASMTMKAGTFPSATHFAIHDNEAGAEVYNSHA